MNLSMALRLQPAEVVALVGGGGKTSAMFQLAAEIVAAGGRVITTTTTRIFEAQIGLAPVHFVAGAVSLGDISAALDRTGHVLITGPVDAAAGKAFGIAPEFVTALQNLPGRPIVIIEADGSRMRPFKAPADNEPVIPAQTSLVVPVVGIDVLGRRLSDESVHRAARVATLSGAAIGDTVSPDIVASILAHTAGGLKNAPVHVRRMVLINKVESPDDVVGARSIAGLLQRSGCYSGVVLAKVRRDPPVVEVWGKVAAVVLAAGQSSRMGQLKQVMPWEGGGTVIGEVVQRLLRSAGVAEIVVVTGRDRERVEASVAGAVATAAAVAQMPEAPPVRTVFNPKFDRAEMARSLEVGLDALADDTLAALVTLGDQPQLRREVVATLLQRWRETQAAVVAPFYHGQQGNPVVLDRAVWPLVRALPDTANPRQIFQAVGRFEGVELDDETILRDFDTPEEYAREVERARRGIISPHGL